MLHDIAKEMSTDEMIASAEKYGHTVSQFCLNNPGFKYHPTGRPDMSMLEKISSFLDDMESHYGSSGESIMKAIGLGEQELKALRDKYLE